jgi:haloalkane dehalogenase
MALEFQAFVPRDAREASAAFARPHRHVAAGPGRLAYWRFGRGPDVVLVHGWPVHSATFRGVVPALARHFTLHLFDLPGAGQTEWNGPIDLASNAAALRRAIDELGLGRYALVAHDSGGTVARLLAAEDARVLGLVLGNTELPGHLPWQVRLYTWAAKRPSVARLMLGGMRLRSLRRSFLGFGGVFRDPAYVDGDFAEWFVKPLLGSRRVAAGQMALMRSLDLHLIDELASVHARIRAPVLCIWGSEDPFFPLALARRMLGQFGGGAELIAIAGAKLFAHEDHPGAFAAHAVPFLEDCTRSSEGASRTMPATAGRPMTA